MKYCSHCGNQVLDEAVVCVKCGCALQPMAPPPPSAAPVVVKDDTMSIVIKVFLVLGCIAQGWCIIPLAWCIPITVSIFKKLKNEEKIGTGLKVCTLLFVNLVSGICLLCVDD